MPYEIVIIQKSTNNPVAVYRKPADFLNPASEVGKDDPFKPKTETQALTLMYNLVDSGVIVQNREYLIQLKPPRVDIAITLKACVLEGIVTNSDNVYMECLDLDSLIEAGEQNGFTEYGEWCAVTDDEYVAHIERAGQDE